MTAKEEVIEILNRMRFNSEDFTPETIADALEREDLISMNAHLEALRRISDALGHPYRGDTTKSCLDLADLAVIKIGIGREKEELKRSPFTQHWVDMGMKLP
jgi:hypothetical protein